MSSSTDVPLNRFKKDSEKGRILHAEIETLKTQIQTILSVINEGIDATKAPLPPPPPPPGGPDWWKEYRRLLEIVERTNKAIENGFGKGNSL